MPDCPSDNDLAGFLNDSLPSEQIAGLSAHVDGCPSCQTRLDKLTHDTHGAVARYKERSSATKQSSPRAGTPVLGNVPRIGAKASALPQVPGFDVGEEIGRGRTGVVYQARHRRLNRLCALKVIFAGGAADTHTVERFLQEAEHLGRVRHPQVVQLFEVDTFPGPGGVPIPYIAMELLEGGSLTRRLKSGVLAPRDATELTESLARALHAAHIQGVIHRDLKPGNILFPESGVTKPVPKVTDFGLAKFIEAGADFAGTGQIVGTPHYSAPEQAAGSKEIGPHADVYALGAILFECLTGRPPFTGDEPISVTLRVVNEQAPDVRTLRPDVPRDLAAVIARCLEKDARNRYASAAELADDLQRLLEKRPAPARPVRRRERLRLWIKRNWVVASLAVALVIAVVVLIVR